MIGRANILTSARIMGKLFYSFFVLHTFNLVRSHPRRKVLIPS